MVAASFCPYVGLQPFTEDDRAYFFGREREIRLVGANLFAAKLTVLYGESGVGKSSLLMAGVVLSIREDSLSKLDRLRARIPTVLANPLRIRHLRPQDARDAMQKPLEVYNTRPEVAGQAVAIETALVDALVEQTISGRVSLAQAGGASAGDAAAGERVEAPYLQLVLTRLWDEELRVRSSLLLRAETLETLGGASTIVRTHLDQVMSTLSEDDRALCAKFFDRLVTPSGSKIACRLDDLKKWALDDLKQWAGPEHAARVQRVVTELTTTEARILRAIDPLPGQPRQYEIFHDVLAAGVLEWRSRYGEARKLEEARAEAERQRQEAEHERERAEAARRSARRLRVFSLAVVVLSLLAALAAWMAYQGQQDAEASAREARARQLALESSQLLEVDPDRAQLLAVEAYRSAALAASESSVRVAHDRFFLSKAALRGHSDWVSHAAFSSDGKLVVTASDDGTARLWDLAGKPVAELKGHGGSVRAAAFSPDGRLVVTASEDDAARLWDLVGKPVAELQGHGDSVLAAAFSPDGKLVVTASEDGTARIWPCAVCGPIEPMIDAIGRRVGRVLTDEERAMYGLPAATTRPDDRTAR